MSDDREELVELEEADEAAEEEQPPAPLNTRRLSLVIGLICATVMIVRGLFYTALCNSFWGPSYNRFCVEQAISPLAFSSGLLMIVFVALAWVRKQPWLLIPAILVTVPVYLQEDAVDSGGGSLSRLLIAIVAAVVIVAIVSLIGTQISKHHEDAAAAELEAAELDDTPGSADELS